MCLSIPFRHVLKSSRWRVKGGAQLIAPMCTCSESFASPSKNAVSLILQFLASKCSGRCSNIKLVANRKSQQGHSCVVIIHPDWLIRSNFRLRRSDKFA